MQSPDFTNPTSWAWNTTVDRELPWAMRGTLSYVGRSASNLERARNINQLQAGTIQRNPGVNSNALRPYLGYGSITLYETTGRSRYNSLQTQVERRSTRGVGFSVAYTFSRTTDNGSGRGDILPDAYDDSGYYGISDLDRPHVLVSQVRYRFPDLESSVAPLRWMWQLGCLGDLPGAVGRSVRHSHARWRGRRRRRAWQRQPVLRSDLGRSVSGENRLGPGAVSRASGSTAMRSARRPLAPSRRRRRRTRCGSPGSGTSTCRSGRASTLPARTHRFDLRVEMFNILNRTRLGNAVTNPSLSDFGYITSLVGNRTMQIGMQYLF